MTASCGWLRAGDPLVLEEELETAVVTGREQATATGCGIVVTRHSRGLFTFALNMEVPAGTTVERDRWSRTNQA